MSETGRENGNGASLAVALAGGVARRAVTRATIRHQLEPLLPPLRFEVFPEGTSSSGATSSSSRTWTLARGACGVVRPSLVIEGEYGALPPVEPCGPPVASYAKDAVGVGAGLLSVFSFFLGAPRLGVALALAGGALLGVGELERRFFSQVRS